MCMYASKTNTTVTHAIVVIVLVNVDTLVPFCKSFKRFPKGKVPRDSLVTLLVIFVGSSLFVTVHRTMPSFA